MSKKRKLLERSIHGLFLILGPVTVGCVLLISSYLIISGLPAIQKIGLGSFLFGKEWASTAAEPAYGILPFILTSIYGTAGAIVLGVPIGFFTAVYLAKLAPKRVKSLVSGAVNLLAGIPSVVYGLVGMLFFCELLRLFLTHPGIASTREQLFDEVWGMDYVGESRTVDMHIRTLRQKLGTYGDRIETVRNVGYRLEVTK